MSLHDLSFGLGETATVPVPSGWWLSGNLMAQVPQIEAHIARQVGATAVRLQSMPGSPATRWIGLPNPTQLVATFVRTGSASQPALEPTESQWWGDFARSFGRGVREDVSKAGAALKPGGFPWLTGGAIGLAAVLALILIARR